MKSIIISNLMILIFLILNLTKMSALIPNESGYKSINLLKNESFRKFLIGPNFGYGLATCRFDYPGKVAPPLTSFRLVPNAGLSIDWRITNSFSLDLDFKYVEKGYKLNMDQWIQDINNNDPEGDKIGSSSAEGYTTMKLSYAEMSFYPVIVFAEIIEIGAGGYLAYGLNGKRISDFTIKYDFPDLPIPNETYQTEKKIEFVDIFPSNIEDNFIYLNRFDYGIIGHLGFRIHAFKVSLGASYSLKQIEPDSKLSSLFLESYEHTYNLNGFLSVSWYPGAK
jgi:hypothetical protein